MPPTGALSPGGRALCLVVGALVLSAPRGYAQAPAETPTPGPAPLFGPAAAPVPGGAVRVISFADVHGASGDVVDAGGFEVANGTTSTERVLAVRIDLSESAVFSEVSLAASGQTVTITAPGSRASFFFTPPIEIPAASTLDFTLTGTIASAATTSATATPTPVETSTVPTATPTRVSSPFLGRVGQGPGDRASPGGGGSGEGGSRDGIAVVLAMIGLSAALLGQGARSRRGVAALAIFLAGVALYEGCGGDQTSEQTVTAVTVEVPSGPATMSGLPASLGTVSRPEPLVFPGAAASPT